MSLDQKRSLLQGCRLLTERDIFDEHGHLSARIAPDSNTFRINARSSPQTASLGDIIEVDLDEDAYPEQAPGETCIHAQIYRNRSDVHSICHNHSPYGITVSSLGAEIRPVHPNGAIQESAVDVYEDYHEEGGALITTDEEARELADALGDDSALMLRGHGAVVVGETVEEAIVCSLKLEYNARLLYKQLVADEPWYLPEPLIEEEVERVHSASGIEKSLDYYLENLE